MAGDNTTGPSHSIGATIVLYGAAPFEPTYPPFVPPTIPPLDPGVFRPVVDPPPPYAADPESAALNAMLKLDDEARRRVMRYLVSRYGEVKP